MTDMHHHETEDLFYEDFLNDTLLQMWFDPELADFDLLKSEMEPVLMDTIMTAVLAALSPEQREKVDELFAAEKEYEALEYIEEVIPDYDDFLGDVFEEFQKNQILAMNKNKK